MVKSTQTTSPHSPLNSPHVLSNGACWMLNPIEWLNIRKINHVVAFIEADADTGFTLCSYATWQQKNPQAMRAFMSNWMAKNSSAVESLCNQLTSYRNGNVNSVHKGALEKDWFRYELHGKILARLTNFQCLFFINTSTSTSTTTHPIALNPTSEFERTYDGVYAFYNCRGRMGLIFPMHPNGEMLSDHVETSWSRPRFKRGD